MLPSPNDPKPSFFSVLTTDLRPRHVITVIILLALAIALTRVINLGFKRALERHRLGPRISLVARDARVDPRPALDGWVRVGSLPRDRREAQERSALPVHADDTGPLDREFVRGDGLREHEHIALTAGLYPHKPRIGAP